MARRPSPLEANFPIPDDFVVLAKRWRADAIEVLLGYVWQGYDGLRKAKYVFRADQEDIEREITQLLAQEIRDEMKGESPFFLEHGPYERETQKTAKAQPPQNDLGFILRANRRAIWPLEAKVLKTDRQVAEYVNEIKESYLGCRYAPFSSEGAMLGYLLAGSPKIALTQIAESLTCALTDHSAFPQRATPFQNIFGTYLRANHTRALLSVTTLSFFYLIKWMGLTTEAVPLSYKVVDKMRLSKDKTALKVNPSLTLAGIPPAVFQYRLGNRSALDWVIDQYQVSEDQRSGIKSDPNRADDVEYIVRLVGQVVHVSLETVKIVTGLPQEFS